MKTIKSTLSVLLAALLVCLLMVPAQAVGPLDDSQKTKLTLIFQYNGSPVSGIPCNLYKIADRTNYSEFTPVDTPLGSKYKELYLSKLDNKEPIDKTFWQGLAETLKAYVIDSTNNVTPTETEKTDENGILTFSGLDNSGLDNSGLDNSGLDKGLYLVVVQSYNRYSSSPFLIALPGIDIDNNTWQYKYAVTLEKKLSYSPKKSSSKKTDPPSEDSQTDSETYTRKVLKVWEDEDDSLRPSSVQMRLLHNGEVYDTVQLTAENNWTYTWEGLTDDMGWDVEEVMDDPLLENYLPLTEWDGITCVVTNMATTEFEDEDTPLDEGPPVEDSDDETITLDIPDDSIPLNDASPTPDSSTSTTTTTTTSTQSNERLPQTGLLWWPVPVLAGVGVLCVVIGIVRRRGDDGE